jgi:hypothetical protein
MTQLAILLGLLNLFKDLHFISINRPRNNLQHD